mgnify:CR=1 FL=1
MRIRSLAACILLTLSLAGACAKEKPVKPPVARPAPAPVAPPKPTCTTVAAHAVSLCLQDYRCQKYVNGMTMGWLVDECNQHFHDREDLLSCVSQLKTIDGARECAKLGLGSYTLPTVDDGSIP